jgi:hypothetical protein
MIDKPKHSSTTIGEIKKKQAAADVGDATIADVSEGMSKPYMNSLFSAVAEGKLKLPNQDFYVVMLTKVERLLTKNVHFYPIVRLTCPSTNYDQSVYFYDHKNETLEFLWTIPDKETIFRFKMYPETITEEEKPLIPYVKNYLSLHYDRLARIRNGEKENQINPILTIHK